MVEPTPSSGLAEALVAALDALAAAGAKHALLGGLAVNFHGVPRLTLDIDVVLRLPRVAWPGLLQQLEARGFRYARPGDPERSQQDVLEEVARDSLTALWHGDFRLDLLCATDPLHAEALDRSIPVHALDRDIPVVRAEHLILLKWIAARPKDLLDVDGILADQGPALDLAIVRTWLPAIEASGGLSALAFEERVRRIVGGAPPPA